MPKGRGSDVIEWLSFLFVAGDCMAFLVEAGYHRYNWRRLWGTDTPSKLPNTIFWAICGDAKTTRARQGEDAQRNIGNTSSTCTQQTNMHS